MKYLDPNVLTMGVGAAKDASGVVYWCVILG
jgi:hypothetical protein